ncbi:MAG: porin family protein [Hyphomicrobiales bacterium]|nr:porin family protein [Hyphomicrobiales bacterium]
MKRILLTGVALFAFTMGAQAADWNGAYVGISLGARAMDADWTTTKTFDPTGSAITATSPPTAWFDSTNFRRAGYLGYNWQASPMWVFGLEGEFGYANNKDTVHDRIPGLGSFILFGKPSFTEVEADWDGSIKLRGGYLVNPNVMLYGTAGIAFLRVTEKATCPTDTNVCNPVLGTQSFSNSETMRGWTVGGGVEALLGGNWLMRANYSYADYGNFDFQAIPPTASTYGANANLDVMTHTVSVGLAYKF